MDSPASARFAQRLARYAYRPDSPSAPSSTSASTSTSTSTSIPTTPRRSTHALTPDQTCTPSKRKRSPTKASASSASSACSAPTASTSAPSVPSTPVRTPKKPRPFAAPEVYAHLDPVPDHLDLDLSIVFCGINPGKKSSTSGHHFAHPTNKFWRSLQQSGITPRLVSPAEDHLMPQLFSCGLTNLCDRPTSEQSELSTLEMRLSVADLSAKIARYRPAVVCFVGKKIWDVYESVAGKTAGQLEVNPSSAPEPSLPRVKSEGEDLVVKEEPAGSLERLETEGSGIVQLMSLDQDGKVKVEQSNVKKDEDEKVKVEQVEIEQSAPTPRAKAAKTRPKEPMDWTKPRELRLPHEGGYTYFWVTPNTSGLERTPLSEQVVIFTHLKHFAESVKRGPPAGTYRDISMEGTVETVEKIRDAAMRKGKS